MPKGKKNPTPEELIGPEATKYKKDEAPVPDADVELAKTVVKEYGNYLECSRSRRRKWADVWKMYLSMTDDQNNPYLSNLFIPKTHEAVELLAAFLTGANQSIRADGEGKDDTQKAAMVGPFLSFLWRKVLNANDSIVTWIKQAILFGNGIMMVGWDADCGEPFMDPVNIEDVFFSYYHRDLQKSPSVIRRIVRAIKDVQEDEKYNEARTSVVGPGSMADTGANLEGYDESLKQIGDEDSTILLERWTLDRVVTVAPTSDGYKVIRNEENKYRYKSKDGKGKKFIPCVKVRLKNNPLVNRGYDIGAIEPTINIQKAFNSMVNEVFDNVSLINNKGWIKKRGANISPMDLVRRPGFLIEVDDINADIRSEEVSDIKQSALEMIRFLDAEFQQASMVVNLLKGIPGAATATEAAIGDQNVQTLLDRVDSNIKIALSELGQMILAISLENYDENHVVKMLDRDDEVQLAEFNTKEIDGFYDIKVSPDRPSNVSAAVKQKQMLDFAGIVSRDANTLQQYPDLMTKIYKRWLENGGEGDVDYFFQKAEGAANALPGGVSAIPGGIGQTMTPGGTAAGLTPGNAIQSTQIPTITP